MTPGPIRSSVPKSPGTTPRRWPPLPDIGVFVPRCRAAATCQAYGSARWCGASARAISSATATRWRCERPVPPYSENRSPAEIVPLPLVPSHCRTLQVGRGRPHRAAIGALNRECAGLHNLGPVPAERAGFQYRDKRLLLHTLLSICRTSQYCVSFGHTLPGARMARTRHHR
jgi:hypothetical protein